MHPTKIYSGPTEIISSGSVIQYWNQPLEIQVELEDFTLTIIFRFEENQESNLTMTPLIVDNDKLELLFSNYSSSLGSGNSTPLGIGSSLGRQLTLSYRIYALTNDSDKLIHYTIYRRKEGTE